MRQRIELRPGEICRRPGDHQQATVVSVRAHLVEEHDLIGKMLAGSLLSSLSARSSGSRKHGGPADGSPMSPRRRRCTWRQRSIPRCRFCVPNAPWRGRACHRPSGTRSHRSTAACARDARIRRPASTVNGRASFMLERRCGAAVRDDDPRVADRPVRGARSATIMTSRSPLVRLSDASPSRWSRKTCGNPASPVHASGPAPDSPGSRTVASLLTCPTAVAIEVVLCRCDT